MGTSPTGKGERILGHLLVKVPKSLTGAAVSGLNMAQSLLCAALGRVLAGCWLEVELHWWRGAQRHSACPERDAVKASQPGACQLAWPAASKGGTWA